MGIPATGQPLVVPKIPGRALVFTYRRLSRFFHELAERTFEGPITYCSSWPGLEEVDIQSDFYRYYRQPGRASGLSDADYDDIILRSCVTRLLPRERAERMVTAMYRVIDELVARTRPEYLLSVMVDNYMTDLLVRVGRQRGVRPLALVAGAVDNTIQLTAYGEFNKVRDPGADEIEAVLRTWLDDDVLITYGRGRGTYSFWRHLKVFSVWWAKASFFRTAGVIRRDPLNFRYLMGSLPSRDGQSSLFGYRCARYFDVDWQDRLARASRPALFIPLSYTPEATVSYWLNDPRYIQYDDFIVHACETLSRSYRVVLKEHPAAVGVRRWHVYRRLKAIPGVIIVPAEVTARQVMQRIDRVLVGAGTAGVEAALRGKRVATLDRPYYYVDGHYLDLGSADRIAELPQALESFPFPPSTPGMQARLMRRLLEGTLPGHLVPDERIDTEQNFVTSSEGLKRYLHQPPDYTGEHRADVTAYATTPS